MAYFSFVEFYLQIGPRRLLLSSRTGLQSLSSHSQVYFRCLSIGQGPGLDIIFVQYSKDGVKILNHKKFWLKFNPHPVDYKKELRSLLPTLNTQISQFSLSHLRARHWSCLNLKLIIDVLLHSILNTKCQCLWFIFWAL